MQGFLLGVVSSLTAAGVVVVAGSLAVRRRWRRPVALISRLVGVPVERRYDTQKEANADLANDLASARWIRVLAGRGNELTRDSFREVWRDAPSRFEFVEVLLPDPDLTGERSWLGEREAETSRHDPGYGGGLLGEQVRANARYLREVAGRHANVRVRLFNLPNLCRIVATDSVAYLTVYSAREHGRNSPCLVVRNPGVLYDFALRIFATAWTSSRPATPSGQPPVRSADAGSGATGDQQDSP